MNCRILYIFMEGDDDERFFNSVILPKLKKKYDNVMFVKYAQKSKKFEYVEKFIRSIVSMQRDYIYVTDLNNSPCVTAKKQDIRSKLRNIDSNKILVVIKEIESWYLAGLDRETARKLGVNKVPQTTEAVTKERFNRLIPKRFQSRIDFMMEVLKNFSIEVAKRKNKSLNYCLEKYDC